MFGDERPSCPDFAAIMQEWVKQYRGYVFLDYSYVNYLDPFLCISVDTLANQRRLLGWFDSDFRLHLTDRFKNPTGEILIPEDPAFFPQLEARIDELGGGFYG